MNASIRFNWPETAWIIVNQRIRTLNLDTEEAILIEIPELSGVELEFSKSAIVFNLDPGRMLTDSIKNDFQNKSIP